MRPCGMDFFCISEFLQSEDAEHSRRHMVGINLDDSMILDKFKYFESQQNK